MFSGWRVTLLVAVLGAAGAAGLGCAGVTDEDWGFDGGDAGAAPATDAGGPEGGSPDAATADAPPDGGALGDGAPVDGAGGDAGCTVNGTTPASCGPCGVVCPGYGQATAEVGCTPPACTFACKGERYDCNANATDGCEVTDTFPGYHSQASPLYLGMFTCHDGSSAQNVEGSLPTDARPHQSPAIDGFDAAVGGAPDWYRISASGGVCVNNIELTLQVTGSATPACYRLRALTDVATYTCQTSASGACGISQGSGSYGDDTDIYLAVDKTCATVVSEHVSYTVTGHL